MKLTPQDLAAMISGATIILNECTVQFVFGGTMQGEEREDADGRGMGFLADLEEELEEDEEEVEIEETECRKRAVKSTAKSRRVK